MGPVSFVPTYDTSMRWTETRGAMQLVRKSKSNRIRQIIVENQLTF
jgi:hypothetical protein